MCPDNLFRRNGLPCTSGGASSFCYQGACQTLLDQCHYVWGTDSAVANDICYERVNILGDQYGNCGVDEQGNNNNNNNNIYTYILSYIFGKLIKNRSLDT